MFFGFFVVGFVGLLLRFLLVGLFLGQFYFFGFEGRFVVFVGLCLCGGYVCVLLCMVVYCVVVCIVCCVFECG